MLMYFLFRRISRYRHQKSICNCDKTSLLILDYIYVIFSFCQVCMILRDEYYKMSSGFLEASIHLSNEYILNYDVWFNTMWNVRKIISSSAIRIHLSNLYASQVGFKNSFPFTEAHSFYSSLLFLTLRNKLRKGLFEEKGPNVEL